MLLDGIFVIIKGKYIGPEKPGPWANLFYKLNIDVFKLGPLFIVFGLLWLIFLFGLWTNQSWTYILGFGNFHIHTLVFTGWGHYFTNNSCPFIDIKNEIGTMTNRRPVHIPVAQQVYQPTFSSIIQWRSR